LVRIGGDLEHALSAWTSTSRDLTEEKRNRIPALLKMLAENGHETPFEKSSLHFLVTSEIATHIQMLKHRIGVSINGESARYKELKEDKYFLPKDWPQEERDLLEKHCLESFEKYHACYKRLLPILGKKRAKESARFYNPYATQLCVDIMFNFRSFVHFQRLRNEEHAQEEIHDIAREMLKLVIAQGDFKHSVEAFKLTEKLK
jgi:flavin-dependent thymidylate synthase